MLDDAGVVPGRELRRTDALREREQLGEPEAAVAGDARVRGLAARVPAHEGRDDRAPEGLPQVERHVRQPAGMTGVAGGDHRARRAAGALRVRPLRVEPEPKRHPHCRRAGLDQRDCTVDPAAHRDSDPVRVPARADRRADRIRERVEREELSSDRSSLEQRQTAQVLGDAGSIGLDDLHAVDP